MKNLVYILFLLPLLSMGQIVPFGFMGVSCTADPNEKNTVNASSDPNCDEADATTGFTSGSGGINSFDDSDPQTGKWAIKNTSPDGVISYANFTIPGSANLDTYDVTFWAKSTQGSFAQVTAWQNCSGGPSESVTGTWTKYGPYSITASGTVTLRFYSTASASGATDDNIFIDNLSIIKTN